MSVQQQVLEAVADIIDGLHAAPPVVIGSLPSEDSVCIAPSTGSTQETTLDHGGTYTMTCVLNGKHSSQRTVSEALFAIHEGLNNLMDYPKGYGWAISSIRTLSAPGLIEREGDADNTQWLYGSSIEIEYVKDRNTQAPSS